MFSNLGLSRPEPRIELPSVGSNRAGIPRKDEHTAVQDTRHVPMGVHSKHDPKYPTNLTPQSTHNSFRSLNRAHVNTNRGRLARISQDPEDFEDQFETEPTREATRRSDELVSRGCIWLSHTFSCSFLFCFQPCSKCGL